VKWIPSTESEWLRARCSVTVRIGIAVGQRDGKRSGAPAPLVDEVDADAVGIGVEVGEAVDACFLRPPVEGRVPVLHQLLQVRGAGPRLPARVRRPVEPARSRQALPEIVERVRWNVHDEGLNGHERFRSGTDGAARDVPGWKPRESLARHRSTVTAVGKCYPTGELSTSVGANITADPLEMGPPGGSDQARIPFEGMLIAS